MYPFDVTRISAPCWPGWPHEPAPSHWKRFESTEEEFVACIQKLIADEAALRKGTTDG